MEERKNNDRRIGSYSEQKSGVNHTQLFILILTFILVIHTKQYAMNVSYTNQARVL